MSESDFIWLKGRSRFIGIDWATVQNPNKLTLENAESEERSVYKSATDGPIPLSFKGRHLMQKLRTATMAAITFGDWHVFGEALSRARANIAKRMGDLEQQLAQAKAAQVSGFYHDEVPVFQQGAPNHEVLDVVTAEDCAYWVQTIRKLGAELQEMSQELGTERLASDTACEERDQAQSELRWYKKLVQMYAQRSMRLRAKIQDLQNTIKANEDFIELQAQRLRARLDQVEQVAKIVNTPAMSRVLDP